MSIYWRWFLCVLNLINIKCDTTTFMQVVIKWAVDRHYIFEVKIVVINTVRTLQGSVY